MALCLRHHQNGNPIREGNWYTEGPCRDPSHSSDQSGTPSTEMLPSTCLRQAFSLSILIRYLEDLLLLNILLLRCTPTFPQILFATSTDTSPNTDHLHSALISTTLIHGDITITTMDSITALGIAPQPATKRATNPRSRTTPHDTKNTPNPITDTNLKITPLMSITMHSSMSEVDSFSTNTIC